MGLLRKINKEFFLEKRIVFALVYLHEILKNVFISLQNILMSFYYNNSAFYWDNYLINKFKIL